MDELTKRIQAILDLDILLQREIYAGWPESWAQVKWPVGSIRALLLIERGLVHRLSEVAKVWMVGETAVTGILDRLEEDALITRKVDPNDRRSFVLELTEAGHVTVQQIDSLRRTQIESALKTMASEEVEALYRGLGALTQALTARHKIMEDEPVHE